MYSNLLPAVEVAGNYHLY
jgi:hypothetical protein